MLKRGDISTAEEDSPPVRPAAAAGSLPRVGPAEAVRRHKLLAVLPLILFVGLAAAYGFATTPTYTAESYQSIGRLDVSEPGALSGFQQATETLAISYSRGINATSVVEDVSERTGLSHGEVRDRLASYPVPESSVFVVAAIGDSEEEAVDLSIEGTRALQKYIAEINSENPNSVRLLKEFRRATARESRLRTQFIRLQRTAGAGSRQLRRLQTRVAAAELQADVARINFGEAQDSQSVVSLVQDLALAETADSDRFERLQMALFIAVGAGILLGIALATLRANRDVRRALSVS